MIDKWKQIPLKTRLLILFIAGFVLIVGQLYYFNMLVLAAGMALLLVCFFSLHEAPSDAYEPIHKFKLFVAPVIVATGGAIAGLVMYGGVFMAISASIVAVSIFTMFIGEILLSFNQPRVYRGFYAYIAAGIFFVIGLFIIVTFLSARDEEPIRKVSGAWEGSYRFAAGARDGCEMSDVIVVTADDRAENFRYRVSISSDVECTSDTVAAIAQYEDIQAHGIETSDGLVVFRYRAGVSDTLCRLYRAPARVEISRHRDFSDEE